MKALLIIDMQNGCFAEGRDGLERVVENINILADRFRSQGYVVIFIQHDGTRENELFPGTPDWEFIPSLVRRDTDLKVDKTANDAFYKTNLHEILSVRNISDIYICGNATDFCVDATVKSALVRDYLTTVIADGHTTTDKPGLPARALIQYYNWIWQAMSPTRSVIKVIPAQEVTLSS